MVGGAQGVLDLTVAYARDREQFGQAIGAFQAVAHHCANMAIDVLSSRFIAYEAIWKLASGAGAGTANWVLASGSNVVSGIGTVTPGAGAFGSFACSFFLWLFGRFIESKPVVAAPKPCGLPETGVAPMRDGAVNVLVAGAWV